MVNLDPTYTMLHSRESERVDAFRLLQLLVFEVFD
jgi:hypothetical protein